MDYTYSYSGADCDAYAYFDHDESNKVYKINTLATISISVHEAKSPVRRLGDRGICGVTSSIRTIAGSMIMLTIEDHPLGEMLSDQLNYVQSWSRDQDRGKSNSSYRNLSTMLPEFNVLLVYKTEIAKNNKKKSFNKKRVGENTSVLIKGIHLVNEGMVTSINDLVTEVSFQFISKDIHMIENKIKSENIFFERLDDYTKKETRKREEEKEKERQEEEVKRIVESGKISLIEAGEKIQKILVQIQKIKSEQELEEIQKRQEFVVEEYNEKTKHLHRWR